MKATLKRAGIALALAAVSSLGVTAQSGANAIDGRWDAALVRSNGDTIPFRLDISGNGSTTKGTFYNGFKSFDSTTAGSFQDGKLTLNIDHYLTAIHAELHHKIFDGAEEGVVVVVAGFDELVEMIGT